MDRRNWVHFFRGYLSVFSVFPVFPPVEIEPLLPRRSSYGGPFVEVGKSLRWAIERVGDEAERLDSSRGRKPSA